MKSRIGPISSSESALKATYGNVGGKKKFSPAAGFRPEKFSPPPDTNPVYATDAGVFGKSLW